VLRVLGTRKGTTARPPLITRHALCETRQRLRILVVDDNAVNQCLAVLLVEKQGHSVATARTGREALAVLAWEPFDLVLMDVQMPDIDGFEATRAIRAEESRTGKHLPIIAMTAHTMPGDRDRCLAAGMDGYVTKPFRMQDLFATIENVRSDRHQVEAPPQA
jgi:two-component system, sensor histidine kinase and response regulator